MLRKNEKFHSIKRDCKFPMSSTNSEANKDVTSSCSDSLAEAQQQQQTCLIYISYW